MTIQDRLIGRKLITEYQSVNLVKISFDDFEEDKVE